MNAASHPMLPPMGLANFLSCAWTLLFIAVGCVLALRFSLWFILCPSPESGKRWGCWAQANWMQLTPCLCLLLSFLHGCVWVICQDLDACRRPYWLDLVNAHDWMFFAMCYTTGQWWKATMQVEIKTKWKKKMPAIEMKVETDGSEGMGKQSGRGGSAEDMKDLRRERRGRWI